jgi:hypothetical protein
MLKTLKLNYYKLLLTYITFNNKLYYPLIQNNFKKYSYYRELIEQIRYNYK